MILFRASFKADEWNHIEAGIKQRLKALNIFLKDIYHQQFIIKDGIIPGKLIYSCPNFLREMVNVDVPFDIYTHIAGIDLIRDDKGEFYVLEDNLRTPSGVSYMLENRGITYRIFPDLLPRNNVRTCKGLSRPPTEESHDACKSQNKLSYGCITFSRYL